MKFELDENDVEFIKQSLNYVALSLDGDAPDNSDISDKDKIRCLGKCFYLMQILDNPIMDHQGKGVEIKIE